METIQPSDREAVLAAISRPPGRRNAPLPNPRIRITVDGELAFTIEQAAVLKGITPSAMRGELTRYKDVIQPVEKLDGRKNLYLAAAVNEMWNKRPGRGKPRTSTT